VTAPVLGQGAGGLGDFRISIAGAQEKTALLSMGGRWFAPQGATPTTHILKLPLGLIGGLRSDFSDSVENEWFCMRVLRELELPTADVDIATFGAQKVLVVTRFDRRWMGVAAEAAAKRRYTPAPGHWIARLPQEDFCQAIGASMSHKYEADGGPSIEDGLSLLSGSEDAEADRATFALAQLAFWLLAATDVHAKNFSLHHLSGGRYRLTPLYDVLSAWPIIGSGASQIPQSKVKLAMSLRGRRRHYKLDEIQVRHWRGLGDRVGVNGLWARMVQLVESADRAVARVADRAPPRFPERVIAKISAGVRKQAARFLSGA
jgi:serine/threonine-protein kinase HipA